MSHTVWLILYDSWHRWLNRFLFISSWATFSATFDEMRSSGMLWTALRFAFSVRGSSRMFDSKSFFFCFSLSMRKSRPHAAHKSLNRVFYIISIILSYGLYKCKIDFSTLPFITISWPHGLREIMGEFANNVSSTSANNLSRKPPGSADLILVLTPSDDLNSPRILPGLRKRPFYD